MTSSSFEKLNLDDSSSSKKSQTIKHTIEDDCGDNIPVAVILWRVIEYCTRRMANDKASGLFFLIANDKASGLFLLISAANYLGIESLHDLTMMRGKTSEEIQKMFNVKNDFTPEEEAKIRKEFAWVVE